LPSIVCGAGNPVEFLFCIRATPSGLPVGMFVADGAVVTPAGIWAIGTAGSATRLVSKAAIQCGFMAAPPNQLVAKIASEWVLPQPAKRIMQSIQAPLQCFPFAPGAIGPKAYWQSQAEW